MKRFMPYYPSGQGGFTLVEIMIAAAISAVLITGAVILTAQMTREHDRASRDMTTTQQVENAGFWLSRDALSAQIVTAGANNGFPLIFEWQNWQEENMNQVSYDISGDNLVRTHSVRSSPQHPWEAVQQTVIARNVDSSGSLTSCSYSGDVITFKITARLEQTVKTYVYEVKPRPDRSY